MTSKNNRAPLLYYIKLCASFQIYRRTQTGVTVRKRSIRVKIGDFLVPCDLNIWLKTLKNNRASFSILHQVLCIITKPSVNSTWSYSPEALNSGQNRWLFCPLWSRNFGRWHWKTIGHLFYTTPSLVHHFKVMGEFRLELHSEIIRVKIGACPV